MGKDGNVVNCLKNSECGPHWGYIKEYYSLILLNVFKVVQQGNSLY